MNPLISIIIPVYNSERYLVKCLESVKNQSYKNLQIILVNDGSSDNSGNICDEYARQDDRFIVIHKENGGVSSARNRGLNIAEGKYIGFIDSDDYVEHNMISNLLNLNYEKKADILMCGCLKEYKGGKVKSNTNKIETSIQIYDSVGALNKLLDKNEFHGYVCNKLFSRELIKGKEPILFDESIHVCEDMVFCCNAFLKAKCILYDSTKYYHYVFHDNNTTSLFNENKLTALDAYESIINLLMEREEVNLNNYKTSYIQTMISLLMQSIESDHKITTDKLETLQRQLFRFKISELTSWKVQIMCIIARINPHIAYSIWKLRGIFNNQ
jgi:glycosyltransferase involved in cell wall biosynthesis